MVRFLPGCCSALGCANKCVQLLSSSSMISRLFAFSVLDYMKKVS